MDWFSKLLKNKGFIVICITIFVCSIFFSVICYFNFSQLLVLISVLAQVVLQFLIELNFGEAEVKTARMELTNLSGQVLLKQNLNIENNLLSESVNIGSNLPQGFYLLKVSAGGNVYQTQISLNKD